MKAWADSLGKISYPLLSDFYPHGQVAQTYGVLRPDGTSERAIFIVDKNCTIRYVDVHDIDEQPDNDVLLRVLAAVNPEAAERWEEKEKATEYPAFVEPDADVVMYCTSWCPGCRRARLYFEQNGIEYVEIDITRDRAAAARVRGWANGNETTPTFNIKGQIIIDFNIPKLEAALGIKR